MAKKSRDTKPVRRSKRAGRKKEDRGDERSGYRQKIRAKKLAEGNKSKGCSLQVMVLSIPFIGLAAFWFLRS